MLNFKTTATALGVALLTGIGAAQAENAASNNAESIAANANIILCKNIELAEVGEFAPMDLHKEVMELQAGQPCGVKVHNPDNNRR